MTDRTWLAVGVLLLLFAIVAVSMVRSLRAKERSSSASVPPPPEVPDAAVLGAARTEALEATYVSTTTAQDWLDRVPGHTLGRRSPARVQVHDAGVIVLRTGERDLFLPVADLVDVHRSPGQAGKYPGGEGLVVLRWTLRDVDADLVLDTGLRLRHRADADLLVDAVERLVADRDDSTTPTSEEPR
ncbi:hypothetical protein [Actinotalea sp. Marseille-Q4924]|uniref:PH-like domain-containing protein n=1 Tax=Actinotalea sp. Marseille-Q4924 TaxID=2866571 RepID=UPI001CE3EEA5|nr:hypothetical protein [Actinotalea sp. Marseille-Q4924]